jgi:phosphatidylethanolamine/phosphatidyl-N-methylethanolamine N-methyltransferase
MGTLNLFFNRLRFTLYSPIYDPLVKLISRKRARSIELLDIHPKHKVLLLGAGTGLDVPFLPVGAEYSAIDLTPAMLQQMKSRAEKRNLNLQALVMDAHHLEFSGATFDRVILHYIIAVVPDPKQCLLEVSRVLKPGGKAVVYDKFIPDGQSPSLLRQLLNPVAYLIGTSINRKLEELLPESGLKKVFEEPADLNGFFRITLLEKIDDK